MILNAFILFFFKQTIINLLIIYYGPAQDNK
jgi:hypothetical protein